MTFSNADIWDEEMTTDKQRKPISNTCKSPSAKRFLFHEWLSRVARSSFEVLSTKDSKFFLASANCSEAAFLLLHATIITIATSGLSWRISPQARLSVNEPKANAIRMFTFCSSGVWVFFFGAYVMCGKHRWTAKSVLIWENFRCGFSS